MLDESGTFVRKPLPESCVDKKTSEMKLMMVALLYVVRRKRVKEELVQYHDYTGRISHEALHEKLRKAGVFQFIDTICCEKVSQPGLHIDKNRPCPKLIPLCYTYVQNCNVEFMCSRCGVEASLGILQSK